MDLSKVFDTLPHDLIVIHGYEVPGGIGELLHELSTTYNLRGKHILELPKVNTTTYGLKSWRYTAAKIWNALPDQFLAANNGRFYTRGRIIRLDELGQTFVVRRVIRL